MQDILATDYIYFAYKRYPEAISVKNIFLNLMAKPDLKAFKKELSKSVKNLRNYEKKAQNLTMNQLAKSHKSMKASIEGIIKNGSI